MENTKNTDTKPKELTLEDYQKKVAELKTTITAKDAELSAKQAIIDTQDNQIVKSDKVVIANSEKQKIINAGLIPVRIGKVLKGAISNVIEGVHLDKLSKERIAELDELGTVFLIIKD